MPTNFRQLFKLVLMSCLAPGAFAVVFRFERSRIANAETARLRATEVPENAPDSIKLASMGLKAGKQLRVYVLVSSRCGFCQDPQTKLALRGLRKQLRTTHAARYSRISVVAVSVDERITRGLKYLEEIGFSSFDQLSTGEGWLNDDATQLLWKNAYSEPLVPQLLVVERNMDGTPEPLTLSFGSDSLLTIVRGRQELLDWTKSGVPLRYTQLTLPKDITR